MKITRIGFVKYACRSGVELSALVFKRRGVEDVTNSNEPTMVVKFVFGKYRVEIYASPENDVLLVIFSPSIQILDHVLS
jgi:hypothetical protein